MILFLPPTPSAIYVAWSSDQESKSIVLLKNLCIQVQIIYLLIYWWNTHNPFPTIKNGLLFWFMNKQIHIFKLVSIQQSGFAVENYLSRSISFLYMCFHLLSQNIQRVSHGKWKACGQRSERWVCRYNE